MEEYSIEASEDFAELHGYFKIMDMMTLVSFFQDKGFTCFVPGNQNSTVRMSRIDFTKNEKDKLENEIKTVSEGLLEEERKKTKKLEIKIKDLETVVRYLNELFLKCFNREFLKEIKIGCMKESEGVQKIIDSMD